MEGSWEAAMRCWTWSRTGVGRKWLWKQHARVITQTGDYEMWRTSLDTSYF